jgi:TatD DNase family protein
MKLIDSHCHIHDTEFFGDQREAVYARAVEAGVGMIAVGTDQQSSVEAVRFAESHDGVWAAVGVHPHDTKDGWETIAELAGSSQKVVAIGEIGLDYFYNHSLREVQIQGLEQQLQIALDNNLPVSFHVREAFTDFWPIFDNFPGLRGVLHSFTDSRANAEAGLERGLYIGVNGISTFTKDANQQELYRSLPLEKILLETDAPFLTPAPFRGKMNEVGYVELVGQWVAQSRGLSFDDVAAVTTSSARSLFSI